MNKLATSLILGLLVALTACSSKAPARWNVEIPEARRKSIYSDIQSIEYKANKIINDYYSNLDFNKVTPDEEMIKKRKEIFLALTDEPKQQLAKKNNLSMEGLMKIDEEGFVKRWGGPRQESLDSYIRKYEPPPGKYY